MKEQEEELWNQEPYVTQPREAIQKKSNTKRTITIIVIVIITLICLLTALAVNKIMPLVEIPQNKAKYREEGYIEKDVMKYLQERYGEEFVIESIRGRSYAYDYINMYAYPKDYQDESHKFKIQGRYNDKGILEYCDSYVMIKLRDDYEAYVDPIIDEYFDDYKFYLEFNSEWITTNLPTDLTVNDLLQLRANVDYPLPDLVIFLKSSQKQNYSESNIKDMTYKLAEWGYRGSIHTAYYEIDELYEKKNNDNKRKNSSEEMENSEWHVLFVHDEEKIDYR